MRKALVVLGLLAVVMSPAAWAGDAAEGQPAAEKTKEAAAAPPLPFHSVEGMGGAFAVPSAYLVNSGAEGEVFGLPSFGGMHVHLGHGRVLDSLSATETLWGRVELGYAIDHFDAGDLGQDIQNTTGMTIGDGAVNLHNFNARVQLVRERDFDCKWTPAVTAGVSYKYNETVNGMDDDLAGTLTAIGIEDNEG